jgi:anti-sigma regulatory factor (Ser/Thr protein kinase)
MAEPLRATREIPLGPEPGAAEIRGCSDWLRQQGERLAVPSELVDRLDLCLNELLANVIEHGGAGARSAPVCLQLWLERDGDLRRACLLVSDAGSPFDPLGHRPGPPPRSLADAEPGGLGLVLLRRFADELRYERSQDRNELVVSIHWQPQQGD